MSERAADDVRGEPRRAAAAAGGAAAAAARQQQQQPPQPQRQPPPPPRRLRPEDGGPGAASTSAAAAMATVGERRPLPSPEAMLGQSWNLWVEASKLPGKDGTELDESYKEFGKNREVMGLCREGIIIVRESSMSLLLHDPSQKLPVSILHWYKVSHRYYEDMPIFGLCPAHDDFYLVVCNDCNQVVKPQAFQSHYGTAVWCCLSRLLSPQPPLICQKRKYSGLGFRSWSCQSAKENASAALEKIHPKMDGTLLKPAAGPACPAPASSSVKPGLNCPSIPKPTLPSPGHILNGKGLPAPPVLEKKSEDYSNNRKFLNKRLSEREFDPDIHCGVIDIDTKKPCTRSLTCKFCTFGSRQIGRGYYVFDSRWNRLRCALNLMVEKHLNAQLWKKIPPVPSTTSPVSTRVPHRTNSVPTSHCGVSYLAAATMSPSPVPLSSTCVSPSSKSVPAHGTTLNAQPAASGAVDPVSSMQSRQVSSSSSSPSTPSGLSSVPSSPMARKPQKLKSSKSLRPKDSSGNSTNCHNASSSASGGSGKKRKNSSPLLVPSSSSSASSSSSSHSMESFRKNCVAHSGPPHPAAVASAPGISLNCVVSRANSLGGRHEQPGCRGTSGGNPCESIKRMSVMVNSGDSTLSLGPFVHQAGSELPVNSHGTYPHSHTPLDKLLGKKRKCSPGSSSVNSSGGGSKPTKVARLPAVNNVHTKHAGPSPAAPGLTNSSLLHQVFPHPGICRSQVPPQQSDTVTGETSGGKQSCTPNSPLEKGVWG
ncbi:hypothetical protein MJT46_016026 [Ovis ammon polii x Ovis aries]|nr:hypothetical protein MJT46_016026 [Ovis ammon polii x Ovis aries]